MRIRSSVIAALLVCFSVGLINARELSFREISIPEAVRTSSLDLLYVDTEGFLWLAAGPDLYWYDGLDFNRVFTDTSGRPGDMISALYSTESGDMWLGWQSGHISRVSGDSTMAYEPEEGNPSVPVVGFVEDEKGQLWMATDGEGLYVLAEPGRWYNFDVSDGLPSEDSYDLVQDGDFVLLATDQGLVKASFNKEKYLEVLGKESGLSDQIVKALHRDERGVWLAYYEANIDLLGATGEITQHLPPPHADAHQILRVGQTTWWLSEAGDLYSSWAGSKWRQVNFNESQRIRVKHLAKDHEGHLWVATDKGLFMIDLWYRHFPTEKPVTAIFADSNSLWYSCDGDLWVLNHKSGKDSLIWKGDNPVLSIFVDDFGRVWSGTFDGGVKLWDPAKKTLMKLTEKNGLANNNVLSIDGDEKGVWLGTLGGVSYFKFDEGGNFTRPLRYNRGRGAGVQYIYAVHVCERGEVYLATDGDGVLHWNGKSFEPVDPELENQVVLDVTSDAAGAVWWITPDGRLYVSSGESSRQLPFIEHETGKLAGLKTAANGDILIFHEKGIHRWNPLGKFWTYYGRSFGLGNLQSELHAQSKTENELLCIGTAKGITCLKTDILPQNPQSSTYLTGVELFLEPTSENEFSSDQNHISFRYIGRWYTDPDEVRYRVKLEGYDLDWNISQNTTVTYPRLPPGKYTFSVVAGIDGNFPQNQIKQYKFEISSSLYSRWYVLAIAGLALAALVYWLTRLRIKRLRHEQERERERVRAQYEAIKSQVNPHFLFNSFNTLMALIEEDKDEAVDYLTDLSDFFRHILQFREIDLISVEEELDVVGTYLDLQEKRFGAALQVKIEVSKEARSSKIPPLTMQLLVENAFKHNVVSRSRPLTLRIYSMDDYLVVWNVSQERSQRAPSTGYGLDSIKKKYEFYSGREVIIEQTSEFFAVYLPIILNSQTL